MPAKSKILGSEIDSIEQRKILGFRVDSVTWPEIENFCRTSLSQTTPKHIVTINGEMILQALENPNLASAIHHADLVIPDSTNVFWVADWQNQPLSAITPGSDLIRRLSRLAAELGKSIYLLGAQEGIAAKAAEVLQKSVPNLKVAGTSSADPTDTDVVSEIKKSGADIVFVGYGAPAQEIWIAKYRSEIGAKIFVGLGGTFDMVAGVLPRAPRVFRSLHLEWLWRLILQPKRIKRIWRAVVVFPLRAIFIKK